MTVTASTQPPEPTKRGLQQLAASIVVATTLQFGMPMEAMAAKVDPKAAELQVLLKGGRPGAAPLPGVTGREDVAPPPEVVPAVKVDRAAATRAAYAETVSYTHLTLPTILLV